VFFLCAAGDVNVEFQVTFNLDFTNLTTNTSGLDAFKSDIKTALAQVRHAGQTCRAATGLLGTIT
jgi:hypothetical protein